MTRIVLLGGSGQVGAEVALMLAQMKQLDVRPVSRTRTGSAFLRYCGLPVLHGDVAIAAQAKGLLDGAAVVANFALAIGTPAAALRQNGEIIQRIFEQAPPAATIVFFSTMAVYDRRDGSSSLRNPYEQNKLKTEKLAMRLAAQAGRRLYVLRLGHVAGDLQNINGLWREEILAPPIRAPDPDRASNVTFTAAIAEALLAVAQGRAGPPGLYDLVNSPQWSWREIYAHEAAKLGAELQIEAMAAPGAPSSPAARVKNWARRMAASPRVRPVLERALALAPVSFNERTKARYSVNRMRGEIAALAPQEPIRNGAALWAGLTVNPLPGVRPTREVLALPEFHAPGQVGPRWPSDPAGSPQA